MDEQSTSHPSHPSRQSTATIIEGSGARYLANDVQRAQRVFGTNGSLHTAMEYRFNDVQLLPILRSLWFLFQSKTTKEFKLGVVVGCTHNPPKLVYRAQGTSKHHSAEVHTILHCMAALEDCPVDMQEELRFLAGLADKKLHDKQAEAIARQSMELEKLKSAKADAKTPIDLAEALDPESSDEDHVQDIAINKRKGKGKGKPKQSAEHSEEEKDYTDTSSTMDADADSDCSSDEYENKKVQPRDDIGQRRFGNPPVSQAELMKASNLMKAKGWVGLTVCTSTSPMVLGILSSANTRRVPCSFKYRTVGGKFEHTLSLASARKAIENFENLPEHLKPGSKASEAAEVISELKKCPKKLIKMFGEVHQAAIVAADKASADGTLVSLRSFDDAGKAVAFMQVLVQLSESDIQLLACASPITITINKSMEVKNIMFSTMECFNWIFLRFDVHALESLCARQHHNPRIPNPATALGINSYHSSKLLSVEVIKDAVETLSAMFTPVYGSALANKMRLELMATVDEARQLMPDAAVAAANVAISWCLRHTSDRITSAMTKWMPNLDANGKVVEGTHPVDMFSWTGDWHEVKMLKLLPLARSSRGGTQRIASTPSGVQGITTSLESMWLKPPLHEYKPGAKLVEHAKAYCRDKGITYVDWSTTIKGWDRIPGNKFGKHRHQIKCFLRHGFSKGRCLGVKVCARCYVEVQWDRGIKSAPS